MATVKRYLADPASRIRLRDLVHEETEKLFAEIDSSKFGGEAKLKPEDELVSRIERYEALTGILIPMLVTGCYWGTNDTVKLWEACLQRVANLSGNGGGHVVWLKLRRYPSLLLL